MSKEIIEGFSVDIIRSKRKTIGLQVNHAAEIIMRVPLRTSRRQIADAVRMQREWIADKMQMMRQINQEAMRLHPYSAAELSDLAKRAAATIPARAAYFAALLGVTYGKITIRCQKTKWGSCSAKGNLNFNCLLADMPAEILDSVVAHELCHRIEMNHSKQFYACLQRVCPNYAEARAWLKAHGECYLRRAELRVL